MLWKINITHNALYSSHGHVLKTSAGFPVDHKGLICVWFGNQATETYYCLHLSTVTAGLAKKVLTSMHAATLSSSPGFVKGLFTGRDSFWCPSAGLADPYSGSPLPCGDSTSPGGFLCSTLYSKKWPFPAESYQPHMEALVSTVAWKTEWRKFVKDMPLCEEEVLAPVGAGRSPSALYSPSLLVALHACLTKVSARRECTGVSQDPRMAEDTREGSVSPRTSTEPPLNAHPTGCHLSCGAVSVPVPTGHWPFQALLWAGSPLLQNT